MLFLQASCFTVGTYGNYKQTELVKTNNKNHHQKIPTSQSVWSAAEMHVTST